MAKWQRVIKKKCAQKIAQRNMCARLPATSTPTALSLYSSLPGGNPSANRWRIQARNCVDCELGKSCVKYAPL